MASKLSLTASDGFTFGAYRADPPDRPRGGLVVIQEIFGVNHHIRSVCERFAALGYVALAPAVFDRYTPDFESGYSPAEVEEARRIIPRIDWRAMLRDTAAAVAALQDAGKVGIIGYCLGGTVAFLAAGKLDGLSAAVGYYGGQTAKNADLVPRVPVLLHFGEHDTSIPMSDVERLRQKRPECEIRVYDAGHAFNCDERANYDPVSARLALERTLAFLAKHVG